MPRYGIMDADGMLVYQADRAELPQAGDVIRGYRDDGAVVRMRVTHVVHDLKALRPEVVVDIMRDGWNSYRRQY